MALVKTEYVALSDLTIAGTKIEEGEVILTVESHLAPQMALRAAQSGLAVPKGKQPKAKPPKPTTPGE